MANFAQLDENNNVINVCKVADEDCFNLEGCECEDTAIKFLKEIFGQDTIWKQTSYSGKIRGRLASIGDYYDENLDVFLHPKPYPSWVLSDDYRWISPLGEIPIAADDEIPEGKFRIECGYVWDEDLYQSDNTKGWVFVVN